MMTYSAILVYIVSRILGDGGASFTAAPPTKPLSSSIYGLCMHHGQALSVIALLVAAYTLQFCYRQATFRNSGDGKYGSVPYASGARDWMLGYIPYFPANTLQFMFYVLAGALVLWQLDSTITDSLRRGPISRRCKHSWRL